MDRLRIAIVGAGRMGRIRGLCAKSHPQCELIEIVDTIPQRAQSLAAEIGCSAGTDWERLVERKDLDGVVVATPHKYLAPITAAALRYGKHVFCEKPGARTSAEAETVLRAAYGSWVPGDLQGGEPPARQGSGRVVVGFTLRHHPSIARARELLQAGVIGQPMYVRGRYGHGGRPGYEQEWRGNPELSGGGELLDQGVHLIDLSRWFLGEFEQVLGSVATYFWGAKQGTPNGSVEDNAFLLLRTKVGSVAWLHASWTQWKNIFSFEIYGEDGFLQINGLDGSYGPERLVIARRRAKGGPPEIEKIHFPLGGKKRPLDDVWAREWDAFISRVVNSRVTNNSDQVVRSATGMDAWEALRIVEAVYEASRSAVVVTLQQTKAAVAALTLREHKKGSLTLDSKTSRGLPSSTGRG